MYKINGGLRGITVGGLLGAGLGGLAGAISLLVLKTSGTSMEEVRYWQYNWKKERDASKLAAEAVIEHLTFKLNLKFYTEMCLQKNSPTEKDPLLLARGERVTENTLDNIKLESQAKGENK